MSYYICPAIIMCGPLENFVQSATSYLCQVDYSSSSRLRLTAEESEIAAAAAAVYNYYCCSPRIHPISTRGKATRLWQQVPHSQPLHTDIIIVCCTTHTTPTFKKSKKSKFPDCQLRDRRGRRRGRETTVGLLRERKVRKSGEHTPRWSLGPE